MGHTQIYLYECKCKEIKEKYTQKGTKEHVKLQEIIHRISDHKQNLDTLISQEQINKQTIVIKNIKMNNPSDSVKQLVYKMLKDLRHKSNKDLEIDNEFNFGNFAVYVPANYNKV